MIKDLLVWMVVFMGVMLLFLVILALLVRLSWQVMADVRDLHDYFCHRTEFRMWRWIKEQEAAEPLEVQEQRHLAELERIRQEKAQRDGRRPAMRVYTFLSAKPCRECLEKYD